MSRRLALALLASLSLPATLVAKGPPWISIELPANPWDRETKDAFLVVHAFHHGTPLPLPLTGTAEGIVDGKRRSVPLTFERTSRQGAYAMRNTWGNAGRWVLVITVSQGDHDDVAQAVVRIDNGQVIGVQVPTRKYPDGNFPRKITQQEIEAALNGR
jgi:hypothetical protein